MLTLVSRRYAQGHVLEALSFTPVLIRFISELIINHNTLNTSVCRVVQGIEFWSSFSTFVYHFWENLLVSEKFAESLGVPN